MNGSIMIGIFVATLYSMVAIMYYRNKYETSKAISEIYKQHWIILCDEIISEVDKDGWCRLVVTKEEALKMKEYFDIG